MADPVYPSINDLSSRLQGSLDDSTAEWLKYIQAGAAPRSTSSSDVISQAIVSAIPLLGGYLAGGDRGLYSGAVGAGTGLDTLDKLSQEDQKREDTLNALQANKALQDIQFTRNKLGNIQDVQAIEPFRADIQRETNSQNNLEQQKNRLATLAASHGNRMEEIAASKRGDETFIKSELAKSAINKARAGKLEAITDEERTAVTNEGKDAQNLFQRIAENAGVEGRYLDKKDINEMQTSIPGLEVREDTKPTLKDKKQYVGYLTTYKKMDRLLSELDGELAKNGQAIMGNKSVTQIVKLSELARLQKEKFNGGAAYTLLEKTMAQGSLPKLFNDPNTSIKDAMTALAMGRDPRAYIYEYRKMLREELQDELSVSPFRIKGME